MDVTDLYRYPFKGLSGEALSEVTLSKGQGFPLDRAYALALPTTKFDEADPSPQPKTKFLMLMKNEQLADLSTTFSEDAKELHVRSRSGESLAKGDVTTADGRAGLEAFFQDYLASSLSAPPRIVHADGHQFTDVSVVSPTMMRAVSLINMNSVRALEAAVGRPVHPMRFRANIYFDGAEAWSEFDWMDKEIRIGDVPMKIIFRTRRCPATEVNPETAERDLDPPKELKAHFGHTDLGVYAEILGDGVIRPGDTISV